MPMHNDPQMQALLAGKGPQGAGQAMPARGAPFGMLPPGSGGPSGPMPQMPQQAAQMPVPQRRPMPPATQPPQGRPQPSLMDQLRMMQQMGINMPGGLFGGGAPQGGRGLGPTDGGGDPRALMLQRLLASGLLG